jgi:GT2 family glycosyltransferase
MQADAGHRVAWPVADALPRVQVVVLNWNKPRETAACLDSLLRQDYRNRRIVVIDNGSHDDPAVAFAAYLDRVALIRNDRNLGYCGGNNLGFAVAGDAGADYVWLVNNDAEAAPDCLGRLVAAAEAAPSVGLVSPVIRLHAEPARIWVCGGRFSVATCEFEWFDRLDRAQAAMAADPAGFMLPGTALLVRCALLRQVGVLNDEMFAYHEDIDLAIRSAAAGFASMLVSEAAAYHKHDPDERGPPHMYYYLSRNEFVMWRAHAPSRAVWHKAIWQLNTLLNQLDQCRGLPEHRQAMLAGYWHGLTGTTGAYGPQYRMPWPLRWLLTCCPKLLRRLLRLA